MLNVFKDEVTAMAVEMDEYRVHCVMKKGKYMAGRCDQGGYKKEEKSI